MRYEVRWGPVAEQQLANIWLVEPNRNGVTAAADWLDR